MKVFTSCAVLAALCDAVVASAAVRVFTHDPDSQPRLHSRTRELSPVAARLVLAQRAGVEEYHESDLSKEDVIDAVNEYGVRSPLFSAETSRSKKVLIMLEGVADPEGGVPSLKSYTNFEVNAPVPVASTRGLYVDLAKQMDPENLGGLSDEEVISTTTDFNHFSARMDMAHHTTSMKDFEALFQRLVAQRHWSITVLVTPPEGDVVEQEAAEWGIYQMPASESHLRKRSTAEAGRAARPATADARASRPAASNSTIVKGILPACFSSQAQCEEKTKNCSGHGKCKLKYHDKTAARAYDCYACSCSTTKSENGKSTTKWGGPACQKKDVSVEFWLLVLFTVGLIFVIGFAVGQIWEMGNEELPSVIGAGVSGPTARK